MAATRLADLAVTAVRAATVGRLMAATRLVAMAATELRLVLVTTSRFWTYGIAGQRQAVTVARRLPVTGALAATAAVGATAARRAHSRLGATAGMAAFMVAGIGPLSPNGGNAATRHGGTAAAGAAA